MEVKANKILLINPWIYDFAAYDFWIKPIGLLTIGSILRSFGYRISLIDCLDRYHPDLLKLQGREKPKSKKDGTGKFHREFVQKPACLEDIPRNYCRYGWPLNLFERKLQEAGKPDVVLVTSGMTYWYPGPKKAIEIVRRQFPNSPIVLGGIYATFCYEHAMKHSGADYVIKGEGELKTLQLVDELTHNQSDYSLFPKNVDEYPPPAYDFYAFMGSVPILTSRGCPFQCSFCGSNLISGKYRKRNPQKVVEEILENYYKRRTKNFAFFDDALLVDSKNHLRLILDGIIERRVKANFYTPNGIHPRWLDLDVAQKMFNTGFRSIRLSFETSNPQRQTEMDCKVCDDDLVRALDNLEKAGFERRNIDVYVLMGLPGQALEEIVKTMIFVHQNGAKIRLVSFSPIPGTKEWKKAVEEHGFPEDADPLLHNNSIYPLRSKEMPYESFEKLRILSRVLNNALDQGMNLLDSSEIPTVFRKSVI